MATTGTVHRQPPEQAPVGALHVAAVTSSLADPKMAVADIAARLDLQARGKPDFVTIHHGSGRSSAALWPHLTATFGGTALHGGSSCLGVMTADGVDIGQGDAIGAFAIWDRAGCYGSAMVPFGDSARLAAIAATRLALARAGRAGEAPELVWLTSTPGHEEAVLEGIKEVIGRPALIVGGSAADNAVAGEWCAGSGDGVSNAAVVVSVLFPSTPFGCAYESGYAPTDRRGTVTQAEGRRLLQIDGRPATEVYGEWTDGRIQPPQTGSRSILSEATLAPLGRRYTDVDGIPIHLLAHPAVAHADGGLELFANVAEGEEICLMEGSEASLIQRAGCIAASSRDQLGAIPAAGALVVYCGGCMLAVREHMDNVAAGVATGLGAVPFLGVFSFGEQGEMLDGDSAHGNLMISCITFGRGRPRGSQHGLREQP